MELYNTVVNFKIFTFSCAVAKKVKTTRKRANGGKKAKINPSLETNGRFLPAAQMGFSKLG